MGIRKFCANRLRGGDEPLKSAPIKTLKQQHKLQPQPKPRPLILIPEYEDYILNSLSFSVLFLLREKYHFQVSIYHKRDFCGFKKWFFCRHALVRAEKRKKSDKMWNIAEAKVFIIYKERRKGLFNFDNNNNNKKKNKFRVLTNIRKCVNYKKCVSPCLQFVHELRLEQKIFN